MKVAVADAGHDEEKALAAFAASMAPVRANGVVSLRFSHRAGNSVLADLGEGGGYRVKFPYPEHGCEAVIINTGGGMAGGDCLNCAIDLTDDTQVAVSSQSAEKLYRGDGADTKIAVQLRLGARSRLDWLPQETILFSGARLRRELTVEMNDTASLLLAESVVFGRIAMGEIMMKGFLRDRWRIRRAGQLIFAEDLLLDGPIASHLARPAVAQAARALATILLVDQQAETRLEEVRALIEAKGVVAGASAWNGMLVIRALAEEPDRLRRALAGLLAHMRGKPMPRVWQC